METRIFLSKKITNVYKKIAISPLPKKHKEESHLNSWNANYTAVNGAKCWVLTHSETRYTVYLPDMAASDIPNLRSKLFESLVFMLNRKSAIDPKVLDDFIGDISFYPTNNDKGNIGYNNQRIQDIGSYPSK